MPKGKGVSKQQQGGHSPAALGTPETAAAAAFSESLRDLTDSQELVVVMERLTSKVGAAIEKIWEEIRAQIKTINCLSMNYHIKELYLHNNLITDVTGALKHLTSLQILMLQNNWLHKVEKVISEFKKLRWLHTLNLFNNPLTQEQDYRLYVIYHVPSVQLLDRQLITQKERDAAFGTYCQDQFRVRQSLAFGQRKPYFTVQHISPKKTYKKYPGGDLIIT
ncbi:hypothetical protein chiPu_0006392 [Chiloscyllium punctatum]|uniref:U2A'/phosphoprotein 32 family A C-terminal domain-containing protein n=1 Tax=Chiloscyllium punctatum TaxID=137246 RepID=A0A401SC27_CHIPU|nr:hypothetical protein [Chiloscyllium punctatum]